MATRHAAPRLAAVLLALACSGDATAPDPAPPANRAPVARGEIPAQVVTEGAPAALDGSGYFDDPDGDSLTFAATSSNTAVVRVAVAGTVATLTARTAGEAAVTMTARDPDGLEARAVFAVEAMEHPDRAALAALYNATDGPNWTDNGGWLTDAPLGEWYGVEWHGVTVSDGRVVGLNLHENGLTGSIPPELANLASLKRLWLHDNALTGPIPPELGSLARLRELYLDANDLTGPIPPELGSLASLESLLLSENDLTGPIPPELGGLASLELLWLHANDLTGPIPPELGNLASLQALRLEGNPGLCAPDDPRLRAWLAEVGAQAFACLNRAVRLLPSALMRADGNGLSLALPDDLRAPAAVNVSDPSVVAASVADGWLELAPRSPGSADVEVVPAGGGLPAVAGVVVRAGVGTFGIDIVVNQPAPIGYAEAMTAAADWWSSALDGTEWTDRRVMDSCLGGLAALADELVIFADNVAEPGTRFLAWAGRCRPHVLAAGGGDVTLNTGSGHHVGLWRLTMRHEIGHVLGLVAHGDDAETGLTTGDRAYWIGPRAVEAYRAGGGDPDLPGPPLLQPGGAHWATCELMGRTVCPDPPMDGLSLAALADMGYTVDMTKATPWRKPDNAAVGERFRDVVTVRTAPRSKM